MVSLRLPILLLALLPRASLAVDHAVVVDRSGSMQKFYEGGWAQSLCEHLGEVTAAHGAVDYVGFATSAAVFDGCGSLDFLRGEEGARTYLDRGFDEALENDPDVVWLVTDNVQDDGKVVGSTEAFYAKLRSRSVERVTVFPLPQNPGQAGVVVYALLINGTAAEAYEAEITEFLRRAEEFGETEDLPMKPLDQNTIEAIPVHEIEPLELTAGDEAAMSFDVRFRSRFSHLRVLEAPFVYELQHPWFDDDSLLKPESIEVSVTPERITDLEAGGTSQTYRVHVEFGEVRLKEDWHSQFRAAFSRTGKESLHVPIRYGVDIPRASFQMRQDLLERYHARSPAEARDTGRINGLAGLTQLVAPRNTRIRLTAQVPIVVKYPEGLAVRFVLLPLLLLLLLIGMCILVWRRVATGLRPVRWNVRAESDSGTELSARINARGDLLVSGRVVGHLEGATLLLRDDAFDEETSRDRISLDRRKETEARVYASGTSICLWFHPSTEDGADEKQTRRSRRQE